MSGRGHCMGGVLCLTLCCLLMASCLSATKRDAEDVALMTLKLKSISQQSTGSGYIVRIRLEGSSMPQVYTLNVSDIMQPYYYGVPSNGLVEIHTVSGKAAALFVHPRGIQAVSVSLDESSATETVIPDVEFFNKGGRNITFEKGSNATVNITMRNGQGFRRIRLDYFMGIKNQSKSNQVDVYLDSDSFPFEVLDESRNASEQHANFRLLTASGDVEGSLQLTAEMDFDCRRSSVIPCMRGGYFIAESIPVYQEGHAGPFPEHFLGLVELRYRRRERMSTPEYCSMRQNACSITCIFVGDRPSAVEFIRVAGDLTPSHQVSLANNGFLTVGHMEFTNLTESAEVEYQCKTTSGPLELRYTKKLIIIHNVRVNRSQSAAIPLGNNGTIDATCIADGTPAPAITFTDQNGVPISQVLNSASYHIIQTQLNNSTSKAVLRIYNRTVANRLRYVICFARNTIQGLETQHRTYLYVYQAEEATTASPFQIDQTFNP